MARFTFNLPDIGEGITEAEIVAWHVKPGDEVAEDARLADMMTDKATVEMESPVAGTVLEVGGEVGDIVAIGSALVVIETGGAAKTGDAAGSVCDGGTSRASEVDRPADGDGEAQAASAPGPRSDQVATRIEVETSDPSDVEDALEASELKTPHASGYTSGPAASKPSHSPDGSQDEGGRAHGKVLASPAVRQRARDLGVDLAQVKPAEEGRVRHGDLDAFLSYSAPRGYGTAAPTRPDEPVKVIGLRRRIAENMAASKRHIPHFTYVEECDVTALERLRADLNGTRGVGADGKRPKLTVLPLLIAAICRTLPGFPMINARYDEEANIVTRHGAVHMGIATQTDAGLMVPVIRDAHARNLWQLAREIGRLAEAARSGQARSEELSGSTLTITSLGPLGGIATTPVINRPEVAIIGPNRIIERPAFVADGMGGERLEKRKLMNISISCDHRVVDGYDAAAFVQELKRLIEAPGSILAG